MGVSLRIAEPTGQYRRTLRRFTFSDEDRCQTGYGHNAANNIGDVAEDQAEQVTGDNWPHDDPRWPAACAGCGYEFTAQDRWQRGDNPIFRMPDGTEFVFDHRLGGVAPPGAMIRATWYDDYAKRPGESWIIALPDGGDWITTQKATDGGFWEVTGTAPHLTASPSIWHNAPNGWHGWVRNGVLVDA